MDRTLLSKLKDFYKEDPNDPFNLYALTLEYMKYDVVEAKNYFIVLLRDFPDYLPTYYQAAQFFEDHEEIDRVNAIYQKGIELSITQHNNKAHRELTSAYRSFNEREEL